jgi:O-Antigen ligase
MSAGRAVRHVSESAVRRPGVLRRHRAAADPRSAAGALGFGMVVLLGFSDGGYYASTWGWAGLALGAAAGIQLLLRRTSTPTTLGLLSLGALAALGGWMLLSASWGMVGTEAMREAERCGLYAVVLAALLATVSSSTTRALLCGVLSGVVALAAFALGERVLVAPPLDPYQGSLLKEPIGYANALGMLMALGVVLAIGLLSETREPLRRGALAAAACLSATALVLTSSRGAWLAALVGVAVLAACRLRSGRTVAAIVVAAAFVAIVALPRVSFGDRPAYWGVAISDATDHALVGSGAGSFDDVWLEQRPIPAHVRDAHSLYLETAAELGAIGLALLLCALGGPLVAAARTRARPLVATALAAYAVFLVHAGLDWDWEMPVTTVAGLACGAALLVSEQGLSRS